MRRSFGSLSTVWPARPACAPLWSTSSLCLDERRERKDASAGNPIVSSPLAALLGQGSQLVHELVDVLELPVDGGKAHIGHLIELMQFLHQLLAHDPAFNLRLAHLLNALLDPVGHGLDGRRADRPLLAGFFQSLQNFRPIKRFPPSVFLDHDRKDFLHTLIGGISALAAQAFTAAANADALSRRSEPRQYRRRRMSAPAFAMPESTALSSSSSQKTHFTGADPALL